MPSDLELLSSWRAGDREAGDRLIERHFDALCRFFRTKVSGDLAEVEDLMQRTLLDCADALEQIRDGSFRAYMFGVARNRLYDHLRAELRRPTDLLGTISVRDLRTSPSQQVARAEQGALVVQALQRLPLDFQITLELKYWEQLSDEEIGAVLAISPNTVRSRLSRGRVLLKEALLAMTTDQEATATLSAFAGEP